MVYLNMGLTTSVLKLVGTMPVVSYKLTIFNIVRSQKWPEIFKKFSWSGVEEAGIWLAKLQFRQSFKRDGLQPMHAMSLGVELYW